MKSGPGLLALLLAGCLSRPYVPAEWVEKLAGAEGIAAFSELEQHREDATSQALVVGLRHPQARVRNQCLRLLGTRQDTRWIDAIVPLVNDTDQGVANQAARVLLQLMDTPELVELLQSGKVGEKGAILLTTLVLQDPLEVACQPLLEWILQTTDSERNIVVLRGLREAWNPRAQRRIGKRYPDLVASLEEAHHRLSRRALELAEAPTSSEELRFHAYALYACFGGPKSYPRIQKIYQAVRSPDQRMIGLLLLGLTQSPEAIPELKRIALDRNQSLEFRVAGARALSRMPYQPEAQQALVELLQAPEPNLRERAYGGLAWTGEASCLPALRQAAEKESEPRLRRRARDAVSRVEGRLKTPDDQ